MPRLALGPSEGRVCWLMCIGTIVGGFASPFNRLAESEARSNFRCRPLLFFHFGNHTSGAGEFFEGQVRCAEQVRGADLLGRSILHFRRTTYASLECIRKIELNPSQRIVGKHTIVGEEYRTGSTSRIRVKALCNI